jgi:GT2 family glycosyltransferase
MLHTTGFRIEAEEAVVLPPENTEFSRTLDELPPGLRAGLMRHPDALVYQFLVAAGAGTGATPREASDARAARTPYFLTKLYWADVDEAYSEGQCVVRHLPLGPDRQRVVFDLPSGAMPRFLRWDPADRPGFLHLFSLRLVHKHPDGRPKRTILDWQTPEAIVRSTRLENLEYGSTAIGETFTAMSDDPQIVMEIPPDANADAGGFLSLEVELDWPMSPDYLVASATFGEAVNDARRAQHALRRELHDVRTERDRLADKVKHVGRPRVDILVVCYNSSRWLDGFTTSLRKLTYPADRLRLVFVDNGSHDDSVERIKAAVPTLPMRMDFVATGRNLGFTGGYEEAFRYAEADYYFVVNLDTAIAPDAIDILVTALEDDPQIGIAEARQSPREHPKYYDAVTRETSWCSGACMMIRPSALRRVGGGFERNFFMYCEDVDLSWRMWLHGWKCVYVPKAVVEHYTEDLDPRKTPKTQHYYTMRNGALMHAMYGSKKELVLHYASMLRLAIVSRNPMWHKWLTFKAIFASLRALSAALRGRERRGALGRHPWVFFNGWLFGRHARDLALETTSDKRETDAEVARIGLAVSVVIPTHNRAESFPLILRRLMAQDVGADRFEIIAVDSASGDRTPQMLEEQVQRYSNLTTLRSEKPGAAAARNMGLEAAKAALVVLLDDDILVGPDFIRQVMRAHREHSGRVLLGRIIAPWDDSTDPFERYLLQVQDVNIYDFPDNANVPPNYFYTACVAIPREALGATRFDEGFSVYGVEDIEFGFRLLGGDTRMVFLPNLRVLHDYHPEYESFRRKKYKAGYSLGYFHQRHPEQAQRLTFGRRFVRNYSLLRILRSLSAPAAKLAWFWERIRNRTGPVNRFLFRWWYIDLRLRLYEGLLRFRRGEQPP